MQSRTVLRQVERRPHEVRTPGLPWPSIRRIVVARDDRLGDVVLTIPAVHALQAAYPTARIAMMVRSGYAPLARMVAGVTEVIEDLPGGTPWKQLAEFRPDLLVCVSRGASSVLAGAAVRVRRVVGTAYRMYSPLLHRTVRERRRGGARHELEYALSFAHRCGAPAGPEQFRLVIPAEPSDAVDVWLRERDVGEPFALLHPGSGGSCPAWPVERYLELATRLTSAGRRVVLSVGPQDEAIAQRISASSDEIRALPRFDRGLVELAALSARASVVVTNNTGPLHLACALGTPTLGFFAPWPTCSVGRWGPYAANGWGLVPEVDGAERWSAHRRRTEGPQLIASVPVEAALDGTIALLEERVPSIS